MAGSITQIIPSLLSETWFPSNERATATAIGVISNSLGGLVAFMLGDYSFIFNKVTLYNK